MPVPLIPPALRELPITVEWRDPAPGRTTVVESLDAALELVRWGDELGDPVLAITLVTDARRSPVSRPRRRLERRALPGCRRTAP